MFLDNFKEPFELQNHGIRLPEFKLQDEDYNKYNISKDCSNLEILTALCRVGFKEKLDAGLIPRDKIKEYGERVKYELGVLDKTNFTDYILLVNSVISHAQKNEIPIGFGRGCLSGDSEINVGSSFKPIKDIEVGEYIINKFGELDKVIKVHKYPTNEKLLSFLTNKRGGNPASFTTDHKILTLRNDKVTYGKKDIRRDVSHLDFSDFQWVEAKDINKGDYLIRYAGRTSGAQDINYIDLAQYCINYKIFPDYYDDEFVYYKHSDHKDSELTGRSFSKRHNLGLLRVQNYKKGRGNEETKAKIEECLKKDGIKPEDFKGYSGVIEKKIKRYFEISEEFCYFLGFYIGDGCRVRGNAVIALNSEADTDKIKKLSLYLGDNNLPYSIYYSKKGKSAYIWVQNRVFAEFLENLVYGKCHEKFIPKEFLNLPDEKLKAIFNGLMESDGYRRSKTCSSFRTTSEKLAYQFIWIADYLRIPGNLTVYRSKNLKEKLAYQVSLNESFTEETRKKNLYFYLGDYLAIQVREIKEVESDGFVYDLTIESDPSYQTNSFIVHNSGGGSLVNYLLDFVYSDPIEKGLYFERFVSTSRAKTTWIDGIPYLDGSLICDLDLDFSDEGRTQIIEWLKGIYDGRFSKVATFSTLTTRILVKELCKVILNMTDDEAGNISSLIPEVFGKVYDPEDSRKDSPEFSLFCEKNPIIWQCLVYLHESIRNRGVHPSAYSISYDKLEDWCPLQETPDGLVSTFDMNDIMNHSVKLDLLGLSTLDLVYNTAKAAGVDIKTLDIESYDDVYKYLQDLQAPYGLFQISGHGVVKALRKIKPKNINQLSDVLAIARPGCLNFVDQYADYTNNGTIQSIHPFFDDILAESGGLCLMQETQLAMVKKVGLDLDSAEQVRRCLGKKDTKKIEEWKSKIYEIGLSNKVPLEALDVLFKILIDSSNYSFNKSHSQNYAVLSAISVLLKFKYPNFFYCEALKCAFNKPDSYESVATIQQELPYFGIKLLPPDLIESDMDFKIEGNDIRFGLSAIKGVADKALPKLQSFLDKEKTNKFQFFFVAKEAGLNIAVLSALIQAGCLHSLGENRAKLTLEAQIWGKLNEREWNYCLANGEKYGYDLVVALKSYMNWSDGKPFKESRLNTIRKHTAPYIEIFNKNKEYPVFCNYMYEKLLLGFAWSHNIRQVFESEHPDLQSADCIKNQLDNNQPVKYVATVGETKRWKSKKGTDCFRMELSDETGTLTAMMTGDKLARYAGSFPKEDEIVYIEGKKGDNIIFIDRMEVQNYKIAFNMRDLKKLKEE